MLGPLEKNRTNSKQCNKLTNWGRKNVTCTEIVTTLSRWLRQRKLPMNFIPSTKYLSNKYLFTFRLLFSSLFITKFRSLCSTSFYCFYVTFRKCLTELLKLKFNLHHLYRFNKVCNLNLTVGCLHRQVC